MIAPSLLVLGATMLKDPSANDFAGTEKLDRMVVPGTTVKVALIVPDTKADVLARIPMLLQFQEMR